MIGALKDRLDKYLGRGRHSIAVPVMDGPLHPNHALDHADALFDLDGVDNLTDADGVLWFSTGAKLMNLPTGGQGPATADTFDADISCLAASGQALAIGLAGKGLVIRGGPHDGRKIEALEGRPLICPTAAVFEDPDTLALCVGAIDRLPADWKQDLMAQGHTGQVWRVDLKTGTATKLAEGLYYPYGICPTPQGLLVSEGWKHRLILITGGRKPKEVLPDLPSYPSRIVPAPKGGYVLALFAPRNQLVEFVLRESEFLKVMTEQVHPDNWIAPKLMWGQGFKEPMQGAALKTMGIIKPWAPTWSYGLVVTLDESFSPTASFHSRADGRRHGVTSVCTHGGRIVAGSKGAGTAVIIDLPASSSMTVAAGHQIEEAQS